MGAADKGCLRPGCSKLLDLVCLAKLFPAAHKGLVTEVPRKEILGVETGAGRWGWKDVARCSCSLWLWDAQQSWLGAAKQLCTCTPYLEHLHPQGYQCREVRVQ